MRIWGWRIRGVRPSGSDIRNADVETSSVRPRGSDTATKESKWQALGSFLEVLISGLLSGVLYSLVALGFVLIFKASGVFNYAQGAMVLLAGLALVRSLDFLTAQGACRTALAVVMALLFAGAHHGDLGVGDRALRAGPARQPERSDAVHGDDRGDVRDRGRRADDVRLGRLSAAAVPDRRLDRRRRHVSRRHPGQQARRLGRPDRRRAGRRARRVLPVHQDGPGAARGGRRSRRGAVGRHPDPLDLVRRVAGRRARRAGRGDRLGHQARRAVLDHVPRA